MKTENDSIDLPDVIWIDNLFGETEDTAVYIEELSHTTKYVKADLFHCMAEDQKMALEKIPFTDIFGNYNRDKVYDWFILNKKTIRSALTTGDWWMPISSAPKDGRNILICNSDDYVCEGHFEINSDDKWFEKNTCASDYYDGQIYNPIAWQPLPLPPKEKL